MKLLIIISLLLVQIFAFGQLENQQNNYLLNGLLINPAHAGSNEVLTLNVGIRRQWAGLKGAPKSQYFSAHTLTENHKHGFSMAFLNRSLTIHSSNTLRIGYAYQLKLKKDHHLNFGVDAGFVNQYSDWNQLILNDKDDISFNKSSRASMNPVTRFGTYYYGPKIFFGVATQNLFNFKSFEAVDTKFIDGLGFNIHGGYKFQFDNKLKFTPSVRLKTSGVNQAQIDINSIFEYQYFIAGANFRTNNAFSVLLGVNLWGNTDFVYSFEYNSNQLSTVTSGSHEVILRYRFLFSMNNKDPRFL